MARKTRRFNLGDLMILIAAIGIATVALRTLWRGLTVEPGGSYWSVTPARLIIAMTLSACATPMTLACLACRFRRPRPAWRRLTIQPGTAALIACSVAFAARMVQLAASLRSPHVAGLGTYEFGRISTIPLSDSVPLVLMSTTHGNGVIGKIEPIGCFGVLVTSFTSPCGLAVAAVWLVLALSGRWRPERSWIDRLGRVLGATWIVISILAALP
jgi:hypothetical protein